MWALESPVSTLTNKVVTPTDGKIQVMVTGKTKVTAFVNDEEVRPLSRLWAKAGDSVHFEIKGDRDAASTVTIMYGEATSTIEVPARGPKMSKSDVYDASAINEGNDMTTDAVNLFATPGMGMGYGGMGGALGGGLGAGLLGGILGTALLGNNGNGLLGNRNGAGVAVDPFQSQANMSIMSTLGDIKASVPLSQAQTGQEIMSSNASIGNIVRQTTDTLMANLNMQTQMNQKGFSDNAATTVAQGTTNLLATKDAATQALQSSWLLNQAITNDGDKTRALIQSIDKTNDSRLITELANQVTELRNEGRLRGVEGNITISNNNTATAVAQQQQAQQQQQQLAVLGANIAALYQQNQHIQQGVLNIGSGTVSGNSQTAANTRVS